MALPSILPGVSAPHTARVEYMGRDVGSVRPKEDILNCLFPKKEIEDLKRGFFSFLDIHF